MLETHAFCDLKIRKTSFFALKVFNFKLFRPDFELIGLSVQELPLV